MEIHIPGYVFSYTKFRDRISSKDIYFLMVGWNSHVDYIQTSLCFLKNMLGSHDLYQDHYF